MHRFGLAHARAVLLSLFTAFVLLLSALYVTKAQDTPTGPVVPNSILTTSRAFYVPLIRKNPSTNKYKSGIHLGNRLLDWNVPPDIMLSRLQGTASGKWPSAVVVLSSQLFNIQRSGSSPCNVTGAQVKSPYLFEYLSRAVHHKVYVIVRIFPSPGNFADYAQHGSNHALQIDRLVGKNYCGGGFEHYRATDDIANEMKAIFDLAVGSSDWPSEYLYFEPANEPNSEWYDQQPTTIFPRIMDVAAWSAMDLYFAALYDRATGLNANIHVLTPPMAQHAYAEHYPFDSCAYMNLAGTSGSGYDYMPKTFSTKNSGISWHNYWRKGKEAWANTICPAAPDGNWTSDHVSQYFPSGLKSKLQVGAPPLAFITEADLLSPCQLWGNTLTNKRASANDVAISLRDFISSEHSAQHIVVWNLSNGYTDLSDGNIPSNPSNVCALDTDEKQNIEQAWHEAYSGSQELAWFTMWWLGEE